MWLIVGRIVLSLFGTKRENFMMSFFIKFTEPIYKITRKVVPFSNEGCVPWLSIVLIIVIRVVIVITLGRQ